VALTVQLVSPEQVLFEGEAEMVLCRTIGGGDIAFLHGHTPLLGGLATHPVVLRRADGSEEAFAVHGGFVEVAHDRVIILSDVAELSSEVDVVRAEAAKHRAEELLRRDPDDFAAQAALRRAEVRLEVASGAVGAAPSH
jgi:F-type H+-transporting ATPase subunit epsilon